MFSKDKISVVVGLPASGKTTLISQYIKDFVVHDDSNMLEYLNVQPGEIITDSRFCDSRTREKFVSLCPNEVEFFFFENDPEQCMKNAKYRNDGRSVDVDIKLFSKIYNPTKIDFKVWRPENA